MAHLSAFSAAPKVHTYASRVATAFPEVHLHAVAPWLSIRAEQRRPAVLSREPFEALQHSVQRLQHGLRFPRDEQRLDLNWWRRNWRAQRIDNVPLQLQLRFVGAQRRHNGGGDIAWGWQVASFSALCSRLGCNRCCRSLVFPGQRVHFLYDFLKFVKLTIQVLCWQELLLPLPP